MAHVLVLTHADFEGPARIADVLAGAGHTLEVRRLHRGDPVPGALGRDTVLVVMGGSMGACDLGRPEFPYLQSEIALLRGRIEQHAPTLGVCLGAQLLAAAAGAKVFAMRDRDPRGPRYEVGWGEVRLVNAAEARALQGLPPRIPVLHWHGDTFELPPGAHRLASTDACPEQAFELHGRIFGLQFHVEVGPDEVESFLRSDAEFVRTANGPGGVDELRRDTARLFEAYAPHADRLLRNIVREMTRTD
ncbi:MAG: gamma-glutamyl-gamma-aminobutyrate hydrolase family protein [Myxococcales bacterium]|nr:gamma-glutamyl-gamma-aminobutyrate hydrolase family protein [Myxococcales bacterium]